MEPRSVGVAIVFGTVLANQIVMRTAFGERRLVYLVMQTLNAGLALWIAVLGFPGFEGAPAMRGALVLVFVFRLVWNHHQRQQLHGEPRREELANERERLLAEIEAREDEGKDVESP